MSYPLQKKNMLLLLLFPDFISIVSSLLLCLSLTSSQLHAAPYLLRLLRRPQLSFPAQPQEVFSWTNVRQRGQKAKEKTKQTNLKVSQAVASNPCVGAKPTALRAGAGEGPCFAERGRTKETWNWLPLWHVCPEHPCLLNESTWAPGGFLREREGESWTAGGRGRASCGFCGVVYTEIRASVPGGGSRRRKGIWCQPPTWQKPCSSLHCKSQSSRWWRAAVPGPVRPPPPCAGSASRWGGWRMCRSRAWRPAGIRILLPPARNTCSSPPLRSPRPVTRTPPGPTAPHPVPPRGASASSSGGGCVWERRRSTVRAGMFLATLPSLLPKEPFHSG